MGSVAIEMVTLECGHCGAPFGMSQRTYDERRADKGNFYCPNGHCRVFTAESKDEIIARLERQMKVQRQSEESAWAEVTKKNAELRRVKKRALAGMCPVCKRTFQQVARHVQSKHPDCAADAGVKAKK